MAKWQFEESMDSMDIELFRETCEIHVEKETDREKRKHLKMLCNALQNGLIRDALIDEMAMYEQRLVKTMISMCAMVKVSNKIISI